MSAPPRVVGANGINTHGENNIDVLLVELECWYGLETVDVWLPKRHWFSARWGGCHDGTLIAQDSRDGDILVAHSYGCLRAWHAHQVRDYRAIVCIAPAMGKQVEWRYPQRVHCYHSDGDWAVRIGSRLLFHPFGRAGVEGFKQLEPYGNNHDCEATHGSYFQGDLLRRIADHVALLAGLRPHRSVRNG